MIKNMIFAATLLVMIASCAQIVPAQERDSRCAELEAARAMYESGQLKVSLVHVRMAKAWYRQHCLGARRAAAR